jgi:hypothetical protein
MYLNSAGSQEKNAGALIALTSLTYPLLFGGVGYLYDYQVNSSSKRLFENRKSRAIKRKKEYEAWIRQTGGESQAY